MRLLHIPLLLFAVSLDSEARPKSDDDESVYANLNKSLLEIAQTPVDQLTIDELSAAYGKHISEKHVHVAQYLLDPEFRDDRPIGALLDNLQTYGAYTPKMAEEFSRGVMRALLQHQHVFAEARPLEPGDHLCRCNQRECATISNELVTILGPEYSTFCRTDKVGNCMQTIRRTPNNTNEIDLYCAHSHSNDEQKDHHESGNFDKTHVQCTVSTATEGTRCCNGDMCNDLPIPLLDPLDTILEAKVKELNESLSNWRMGAMALIVFAFILLALLIFIIRCFCKFDLEEMKRKCRSIFVVPSFHGIKLEDTTDRFNARYFHNESIDRSSTAGSEAPLIPPSFSDGSTCGYSIYSTDPTKGTYLDMETTIGLQSGIGGHMMGFKTLAGYIRVLDKPLGQGKFGKVFLGQWRGGELIAIKKFHASQIDSFEQEVEILMAGMMSYSNILRWIGKDTVEVGPTSEYWIISEYHRNGSLYDYMERHSLSLITFLNMMRGIANGITFLHSEIVANQGTSGKREVAHRDLKTKNILVKSDLTCVIADFGMAVIKNASAVKLPPGARTSGTLRYLAPEVLKDEAMGTSNTEFAYFKASDIYSFSLIMWECARRTHADIGDGTIFEHSMEESLAYHSVVPREPTMEDMIEAVVEKELRPDIEELWQRDPLFLDLSRIMTECWVASPLSRLSALNVKRQIDVLAERNKIALPVKHN